jgi:hypothetical protein
MTEIYEILAVVNISPSVIPTYFPSLRIFTYDVNAFVSSPSSTHSQLVFSKSQLRDRFPVLGYTQLFINLTAANLNDGWGPKGVGHGDKEERDEPTWELSYVTWDSEGLDGALSGKTGDPRPWPIELDEYMLSSMSYNSPLESSLRSRSGSISEKLRAVIREESERFCPYRMRTLDTEEWVKVAKNLVREGNEAEWEAFQKRIFLNSGGYDR